MSTNLTFLHRIEAFSPLPPAICNLFDPRQRCDTGVRGRKSRKISKYLGKTEKNVSKWLNLRVYQAETVSVFYPKIQKEETLYEKPEAGSQPGSGLRHAAIEVLNAVQVMIGDRGNFRPDAAVNRHEMAVIMAKLYLGSEEADNYVGSHPFTDVFPWADKYVAACYENDLVSGTSATTFSGNQPLTAIQAAAMMLRALGYEKLSEGASDWRTPVAAKANQIRLFKDVVSSPNTQLNRNQVAQLALNTLKADVVTTTSGSSINLGDIGTITTDVKYETIDYTSEGSSNYAGAGSDRDGYGRQQLCEKLYGTDLKLTDTTDDFGRPAIRWSYKAKEVGKYANEADATYTAEVKAKDLYSDLSLDETTAASVTVDGKEADDFSITKSGETKIGGNGVLVEAYKDDDGKVTITVINPYVGEISRVTPAKDNDERTVTVNGKKFETEGFEEDDVVVYTVADGDIKSMYLAETVSDVEVTRTKSDSEFVASGDTYKYATKWTKVDTTADLVDDKGDVKTENRLDLYLDNYGYVVKVDLNEGVTDYAYVLETDEDGGKLFDDGTPYAKLLLTDGTVVEAELDYDDIDLSKATGKDNKEKLAFVFDGRIVEYRKDSKNVYELTIMKNGDDEAVKTDLKSDETIAIDAGKAKMTLGKEIVYADSKTVFLTDDGDDNYRAYVGYDAVSDLSAVYSAEKGANAAYAYYCESGSVADVVYVFNATEDSDDIVFLLASECSGRITTKDGDDYWECPAVVNGEIVDVKLNQSIEKEKTKVLLKTIIYDNEEEEIIDFAKSKPYSEDEEDDDYYVYGKVTKKLTNGNLTIDGTSYRVASDAQVFVYDDEINGSGRTAIAKDDTGYFVINDGQIVTIFYKEADDSEPEPDLEPADGDPTKDPTGGTVNEVKATFTVEYLHGEDEAEAAEKVLTDAGWTINGRNHNDKKVTASKGAVEKQEFTYTAIEYFTVKVDSTTYYVDESGVAKGAEAELKLDMSKTNGRNGTGYVDGAEKYVKYATDNKEASLVGIKTAAMGSDKKIDDNKEIKTGYVKAPKQITAGAADGGVTVVQNDANDIDYVLAGDTVTYAVKYHTNDTETTADVTLKLTVDGDTDAEPGANATVETGAKIASGSEETVDMTVKAGQKDITTVTVTPDDGKA